MSEPLTHPAPFSATIMDNLADLIADWEGPILDPYAGTGRVHELGRSDTWGIEIEREWAELHERTAWGNSTTMRVVGGDTTLVVVDDMLFPRPRALVFSPDYGNRFSDQYLGTPEERQRRLATGELPRRRSYAISLGRQVTPGSTCRYKFGPLYRELHEQVLRAATDVMLRPGRMACNVSDFYETRDSEVGSERVHVVSFWVELIASLGWVVERMIPVSTSRFRDGANRDLRADAETIIVAHLPEQGASE